MEHLPSSDSTECINVIEEVDRPAKSSMSGEDPSTKLFQTSSKV